MKKTLISLSLLSFLLAACSFPVPQQSSIEPQADAWKQYGTFLDIDKNQDATQAPAWQ